MENLDRFAFTLFDKSTRRLLEEADLSVTISGEYKPDISTTEIHVRFDIVGIVDMGRCWVATLGFMVADSANFYEAIEAINIEVRNWLRKHLGCPVSMRILYHG